MKRTIVRKPKPPDEDVHRDRLESMLFLHPKEAGLGQNDLLLGLIQNNYDNVHEEVDVDSLYKTTDEELQEQRLTIPRYNVTDITDEKLSDEKGLDSFLCTLQTENYTMTELEHVLNAGPTTLLIDTAQPVTEGMDTGQVSVTWKPVWIARDLIPTSVLNRWRSSR